MEQRTLRAMQELARLLCDDADNPSQDEVHARLKGFVVHETAQRQPKQQSRPQGFSVPVASPWDLSDEPGWPARHETRIQKLEQDHEDTKQRLHNTEAIYRHLNELQRQVDRIGEHADTFEDKHDKRLDQQSNDLYALADTVRKLEAKVNRLTL